MSSKISGNTITLTRGDTLRVMVNIQKDGAPYVPEEGDSLEFFLKHSAMNAKRTEYIDKSPLIQKAIPIDSLILELTPADTKELEFGKYVYDIQLTFSDGIVDTFIAAAPFIITEEVG